MSENNDKLAFLAISAVVDAHNDKGISLEQFAAVLGSAYRVADGNSQYVVLEMLLPLAKANLVNEDVIYGMIRQLAERARQDQFMLHRAQAERLVPAAPPQPKPTVH